MRTSLWGRAVLCGSVIFLLSACGGLVAADQRPIDASSFRCSTSMAPVRQFYVGNLRGELRQRAGERQAGAVPVAVFT